MKKNEESNLLTKEFTKYSKRDENIGDDNIDKFVYIYGPGFKCRLTALRSHTWFFNPKLYCFLKYSK